MTNRIRFDDRRSSAWREAVVETARLDGARGRGSRRRVAFVAGLVIAAVVVSGGGVAYALSTHLLTPTVEPTSTPTPTPTATKIPSAAPAITPTPQPPAPAPVNVLDDPTTWIIDFSGVGPVALGSSLISDSTALPSFEDVTDVFCRPSQLNLLNTTDALAVSIFASAEEPDTARTIVLSSWTALGEPVPPTPRTAEGIGLGSTMDQLQAAYPGIERTGSYGDLTFYYGISSPDGAWMVFGVDEGTVSRIQLGPAKTIPSEFCPA